MFTISFYVQILKLEVEIKHDKGRFLNFWKLDWLIFCYIDFPAHIGREERISVHLRPIQSISMPAHVGYQFLFISGFPLIKKYILFYLSIFAHR